MSPQFWPPVPAFSQHGSFVSAASPTTVTFPAPFAAVPAIQVTVVGVGGNVVPEVYALSAAGVRLASVTISPLAYHAGDTVFWEATGIPA